MWPSLEAAVWLYDAANFALVGALVVGVVATFTVVWMGNVKEEHLKRDISAAQERAANANARVAEANLELAKLREQMAGRVVTPEMRDALKALLTFRPDIAVTWVKRGEPGIFGMQIADTLSRLGLLVRRPPSPDDSNGVGTVVVFPESMDEHRKRALADIFLAAGIPDRSSRPWALDDVHADDVVIFVGEKMPAYPK